MWDLICDHQYIWGTIAADRSRWHSDGFSYDVTPLAGGGLSFPTQQSRVAIPRRTGDPWGAIGAIRVEIVANAQPAGGTLIDADGCFRVSFVGLQAIVLEILNYTLTLPLDVVSPGEWLSFNFWHDGVNQLNSNYDVLDRDAGSVSSPSLVPGPVPAVGPQGVSIGNRVGSPANHFNGNVSSVKIWRLDPQTMVPPFLSRPFPPSVSKCWRDLIDRIGAAAAANPDCGGYWGRLVRQQQALLLTRLGQKTPDTLAEFYQMCSAYQALWSAGKVGSPDMQALMVRLRDWLKDQGIFSADDPGLREVLSDPCIAKITGAAGGLDCDPDAQVLIKAILGVGKQP